MSPPPMPFQSTPPRTIPYRHRQVEMGVQQMWWCPDCGQLKEKAQYRRQSTSDVADRFHSNKCPHPLARVLITVEAVVPGVKA